MDANPPSERISKLETKLETHGEQMKVLSRDLRDKRTDMDALALSLRASIEELKKEMTAQLSPLIEKITQLDKANAAYKAERAIIAFLLGGLIAGGAITVGIRSTPTISNGSPPYTTPGGVK